MVEDDNTLGARIAPYEVGGLGVESRLDRVVVAEIGEAFREIAQDVAFALEIEIVAAGPAVLDFDLAQVGAGRVELGSRVRLIKIVIRRDAVIDRVVSGSRAIKRCCSSCVRGSRGWDDRARGRTGLRVAAALAGMVAGVRPS